MLHDPLARVALHAMGPGGCEGLSDAFPSLSFPTGRLAGIDAIKQGSPADTFRSNGDFLKLVFKNALDVFNLDKCFTFLILFLQVF